MAMSCFACSPGFSRVPQGVSDGRLYAADCRRVASRLSAAMTMKQTRSAETNRPARQDDRFRLVAPCPRECPFAAMRVPVQSLLPSDDPGFLDRPELCPALYPRKRQFARRPPEATLQLRAQRPESTDAALVQATRKREVAARKHGHYQDRRVRSRVHAARRRYIREFVAAETACPACHVRVQGLPRQKG
jgi:hypothetical protein